MGVNPTDCSELQTISAPSPNSCSCQALAAARKAGQPLPLTYRYTESLQGLLEWPSAHLLQSDARANGVGACK